MIPLRDDNPIQTVPVVTRTLVVLNVVAFLFELSLGPHLNEFVFGYGLVPMRFEYALGGALPWLPTIGTVFTSMFLHGGWIHLLGNLWYLWIFGDNVEDRLGHARFLFFYLGCGYVATFAHAIADANSQMPAIGASGAIAGVLGAYVFLFPKARVVTLVFLGFFYTTAEIPAVVYLGIWFLMQAFSGVASLGAGTAGQGGVAWFAHIGGFIAGPLLLWVLLDKNRRLPPAPPRLEPWA